MNKILSAIALSGCLWMTTGCSLDILPNDKQTTDMYWKNSTEVESMLAQGYHLMRTCVPYMIDWGEVRASSVITTKTSDAQKLQDFQMLPDNSKAKWATFYQVINIANGVLENAPGVLAEDESYRPEQMNSHLTEAYFMRALMYFYLVRNYKEVPLILNSYINDKMPTDVAKSSEADIIARIKTDIETALATGAAKEVFEHVWEDTDKQAETKGRATKWALYALMADVCLWSEDWDGCITYADKLIFPESDLHPTFMTNSNQWYSMFFPGNSNESIFELQFSAELNQASNTPSKTFNIVVPGTATQLPDYVFSERMTQDLEAEIYPDGTTLSPSSRTYYGSALPIMLTGLGDYYQVWKYMGTQGGIGASYDQTRGGNTLDANFIIYRMADVMCMKAEALIRKGGAANNTAAMDIINQVRLRSGLSPLDPPVNADTYEMLTILLQERNLEFAAEGKRWYDLLRLARQENFRFRDEFVTIITDYNLTASRKALLSALEDPNAWFLPVPQSDINDNLLQNPYYDVVSQK